MKDRIIELIKKTVKHGDRDEVNSSNGGSIITYTREHRIYTVMSDIDWLLLSALADNNECEDSIKEIYPEYISSSISTIENNNETIIRVCVKMCNLSNVYKNSAFVNFAEEVMDEMYDLFEDIDIDYTIYEHGDSVHTYNIKVDSDIFTIAPYKLGVALINYVDSYGVLDKRSSRPFSETEKWLNMDIVCTVYREDENIVELKFRLLEI